MHNMDDGSFTATPSGINKCQNHSVIFEGSNSTDEPSAAVEEALNRYLFDNSLFAITIIS